MKIEMIHQENPRNNSITEFWFKLSENVTHLNANISVQNKHDEINSNSETIYLNNKWYLLAGYENIVGTKWIFVLEGVKSSDKKRFRKTIKYFVT